MRSWILTAIVALVVWPHLLRAQERAHAGGAWEYGTLESSFTSDGWTYLFCRATSEGCIEEVAEPHTNPVVLAERRQTRRLHVDDAFATVLARLGRDGWELTGESRFGADCENCRVMHFKRQVIAR